MNAWCISVSVERCSHKALCRCFWKSKQERPELPGVGRISSSGVPYSLPTRSLLPHSPSLCISVSCPSWLGGCFRVFDRFLLSLDTSSQLGTMCWHGDEDTEGSSEVNYCTHLCLFVWDGGSDMLTYSWTASAFCPAEARAAKGRLIE